ncbi:hypothetical protein B0H13DRAFT_1867642 [Mycena leptocephala]|nr:hypothetical protein B0H13DRAFT_1867642 [Mycena leptocephala]
MSGQSRHPPSCRIAHQPPSPSQPLPERVVRRRVNPLSYNHQAQDEGTGGDAQNGLSNVGMLEPTAAAFTSWNNLMGVAPSLQQFGSDPVTEEDRDLFQSWLDAVRPLPNNSGQDTTILRPNSAHSNSGSHTSGTPSSGSSPAFPLTFLSNFNSSESREHGGHSPFDPSLFNPSSYPVNTSRHTSPERRNLGPAEPQPAIDPEPPIHSAGIAQAGTQTLPRRGRFAQSMQDFLEEDDIDDAAKYAAEIARAVTTDTMSGGHLQTVRIYTGDGDGTGKAVNGWNIEIE